jgi:Spy/CpxP family protein refolding chaperone
MRKILISMALCGGLLLAQGPGGGRGPMPRGYGQQGAMGPMGAGMMGGGVEELKGFLNLSDSQVDQLRTMRRDQIQSARPDAELMRSKAQELRTLMQSQSPDPAKVGALTLELKQLREKMAASRDALSDKAAGILNAEQKTKLKDLEAAAKLGPAVRQAIGIGLIDAPQPATAGKAAAGAGRGRAARAQL